MSEGKFLQQWQVMDNIIEWILMQFTFNIFTSDSNSKNNSWGFENSQMDMRGFIWVWESFFNNDKWQIKLLSEFLCKFTFNILHLNLTQKIITHRVSKIHKWIWGDVYEWGKVSTTMTSDG